MIFPDGQCLQNVFGHDLSALCMQGVVARIDELTEEVYGLHAVIYFPGRAAKLGRGSFHARSREDVSQFLFRRVRIPIVRNQT